MSVAEKVIQSGVVDSVSEMFQLAERLRTLKERKKKLESFEKIINAQIETINDKVVKLMVENETEKFSKRGYTYGMTTKLHASPMEGCKEKFYRWLKRHGYKDLVKETVNAQTLSSQVKEWKELDGKLPKGISAMLNVFEKVTITIRKGKA